MSNHTPMPDPSDPTDRTDRAADSASARDNAETRPLTGPTLVLPAAAPRSGPTPTGAPSDVADAQAAPTTAAPFAWELPGASTRHRPRFATILWGALLLGLAVFMVAWTMFPGTLDPTLWLLAAVIGVGLVLVIAGIAAATRRSD